MIIIEWDDIKKDCDKKIVERLEQDYKYVKSAINGAMGMCNTRKEAIKHINHFGDCVFRIDECIKTLDRIMTDVKLRKEKNDKSGRTDK